MAITYVGASGPFSSVNIVQNIVQPSATAVNDLMIMVLQGGSGVDPVLPPGWTKISGGNTAGRTVTVGYKVATSAGAASVDNVPDSGDHTLVSITSWRGVNLSNPIDAQSAVTEYASTTKRVPGLTTVTNGAMVLAINTLLHDSITAIYSGWTNTSLASITECVDIGTTDGTGGHIGIAYGIATYAGSVNATNVSITVNSAQLAISIALRPHIDIPITSFNAISPINAGTAGSALTIEQAIALMPSSAISQPNSVSIPVTLWSEVVAYTYDPNTPGTYQFVGTLGALPYGTTNPSNYKPYINVIVSAPQYNGKFFQFF